MKAIEKIENRIAALQEELAKLEAIKNIGPDIPEADSVIVGGPLSAYSLYYTVYNLEDVKSIISAVWSSKSVDILTLSLCRNGSTVSFLTPYHGRTGEISAVFPVVVSVSKYDIKFCFYGLSGDDILRFVITIPEGFKSYASVVYTQKQDWHNVKYARLSHPYFKDPSVIKWASGSPKTPPSYTMYWPNASSLDDIFSE